MNNKRLYPVTSKAIKEEDYTASRLNRDIGDQSGYKKKFDKYKIKFTDELKEKFLQNYVVNGQMYLSSNLCGITYCCLRNHLDNDPDFLKAFLTAKEEFYVRHREKVLSHVRNLQFNGITNPVIGGRNRDQVVAHTTTYPIQLLAMEMKLVEKGYVDKQDASQKEGGSGVIIVPAGVSTDDWIAVQEKKNLSKVAPVNV